MADTSGLLSVRKIDSLSESSVSMETITSLTELEDLERVYQQLCTEEVSAEQEPGEGSSGCRQVRSYGFICLFMIDSTGSEMKGMKHKHRICTVDMGVMSGCTTPA
jgi:hypothetical protein